MLKRHPYAAYGPILIGMAAVVTGCVTPASVQVRNGCSETVVFAHFEPDSWAPEYRADKLAEVEWVTIEPGDATKIEIDAASEATTTFTVVAKDAEQIWDPVRVDVHLEDPENWHEGSIELTGDLCAPVES